MPTTQIERINRATGEIFKAVRDDRPIDLEEVKDVHDVLITSVVVPLLENMKEFFESSADYAEERINMRQTEIESLQLQNAADREHATRQMDKVAEFEDIIKAVHEWRG